MSVTANFISALLGSPILVASAELLTVVGEGRVEKTSDPFRVLAVCRVFFFVTDWRLLRVCSAFAALC